MHLVRVSASLVELQRDLAGALRGGGRFVVLTPAYADTFSTATGVIQFERDSAGRVNALRLTQDRVWNLRFVRRAPAGGG